MKTVRAAHVARERTVLARRVPFNFARMKSVHPCKEFRGRRNLVREEYVTCAYTHVDSVYTYSLSFAYHSFDVVQTVTI